MSVRQMEKLGDADFTRGSKLDFCKEPGCMEFAQTSSPDAKDTRKYYCPKHEAAAIARGESGDRVEFKEHKAPYNQHPNHGKTPVTTHENEETPAEVDSPPINEPEIKERIPMPNPSRKVMCVETGVVYDNAQAASDATGVPKGTLGAVLAPSGARKGGRAGGKTWRYVDAADSEDGVHKEKKARLSVRRPISTQSTTPAPAGPSAPPEPADLPKEDVTAAIADGRRLLRPEPLLELLPTGGGPIETLLPSITQAIAAIALNSPGGTIENVFMGMDAGGIRVNVHIKSLRVSTAAASEAN